jgi:X-domain of DnaJ-containing
MSLARRKQLLLVMLLRGLTSWTAQRVYLALCDRAQGCLRPNPGRREGRKPKSRGEEASGGTGCRKGHTSSFQGAPSVSLLAIDMPSLLLSEQGTKLEVESVLRETCDRVLGDPSIPHDKAILRAISLQILGQAYVDVRREQDDAREESEYVRIETRQSRDRGR